MALYELAYTLSVPLSVVLDMSYTELLGWHAFFESRPVGWREDNRTSLIMETFGAKDARKYFPSLSAAKKAEQDNPDKAAIGSIANSRMYQFLASSVGGPRIPL